MPIFQYGQAEMDALCKKDKRLGEVIRAIGPIERELEPELFPSLIGSIISQQISGKAAITVEARLRELAGGVTPARIAALSQAEIQACGMSMRKAEYIRYAAEEVCAGRLNLDALYTMTDAEVIARLSALKGIGVWTAEMLMLFTMQRPNILSYGDFGIHRGMRMVYRHKEIKRELFARYRKRLSPYCSVASLYFWHVAGGALGLNDPAMAHKKKKDSE